MSKKFSKNFGRDYKFYYDNIGRFSFVGSDVEKYRPSVGNMTTKRAFLVFDSTGKLKSCDDPALFVELLKFKKGLNFWIKQWSEGFLDILEPIDYYLNDFKGDVPNWVRTSFLNQIHKCHDDVPKYLIIGADDE